MFKKPLIFIDLTHILTEQAPSWHGTCGFHQQVKQDYQDCGGEVKFRTQELQFEAGIGTHMDAPSHCFPKGASIHEIPLEQLIRPCVVINVSRKVNANYEVSLQDILEFERIFGKIQEKAFVIIYTGWERYWHQPESYRNNLTFPYVSEAVATYLLERNVQGIGIDTLSPDRGDGGFPVHKLFLGAGKYIVENIANASKLPPTGSYTVALPIKIKDATESPMRLIGVLSND